MSKQTLPLVGINEKRLRYFYNVMLLGSIRKTADLLNIEQSAISRQIQLFEAELKTQLFERRGRNVVPTEAAYVVLEYFEENQKRELALLDKKKFVFWTFFHFLHWVDRIDKMIYVHCWMV